MTLEKKGHQENFDLLLDDRHKIGPINNRH